MRLTLHQRCCNCWIAVGLWCGLVQIAASASPAAGPSVPAPSPTTTTTTTPPALPPSSMPVLGVLRQSNPFDAERKLWPDRTPVPPPPPPPPVPTPVTDDDLEVYGVVSAGSVQKALLKLGKRFAQVPVGPTGLASVSVGSVLGEFVLAKVEPDQILLQAPGGQQWVRFSIKKERTGKGNNSAGGGTPSSAMPPPIAMNPPPSMASTAPIAPPFQSSSSPVAASSTPTSDASSNNAAATATPPPTAGSLAAAIAAAQAAQTAAGAGVTPSIPPGMNPFEALLKQQQQGR